MVICESTVKPERIGLVCVEGGIDCSKKFVPQLEMAGGVVNTWQGVSALLTIGAPSAEDIYDICWRLHRGSYLFVMTQLAPAR